MIEISEASGYVLHVDEMDSDHAELFRLIQELEAATSTGNERQVHADVVERLEGYARRHFDCETRLMRDSGFPAVEQQAHEDEHERFLSRILQWRREAESHMRSETAVGSIAGFLQAWLKHHIKGKDADLAAFLLSRGDGRR